MLRKKRKSTLDDDPLPLNRWLTTFNDLATLLMVFFVLLFSMSVIDVKKIKEFQSSLQSGLGVMHAGQKASVAVVDARHRQGAPSAGDGSNPEHSVQQQRSVRKLENSIDQLNELDGVSATYEQRGIAITLEEDFLFAIGSARVIPSSYRQLNRVARVIRRTQHPVRIEGHTDDIPIQSRQFPSNWELSVTRAVRVLRYFIEKGAIAPHRLSAVGYGAVKPIVNNDSPVNRARNRRVEIVVVTED